MKGKMRLVAAIICLCLAAGGVILAATVLNKNITASTENYDGEISTFESSFEGETYYTGDKKGTITEKNASGEVIRSAKLFENEIVQKINVISADKILVCGSGKGVKLVDADLNPIASLNLPGIFITSSYYNDGGAEKFWFGVSSNANYTDLYLFSYVLNGDKFEKIAGGEFCEAVGEEGEEEIKEIDLITRNVTISADGKSLFVFGKKGVVYRVSSDITLLTGGVEELKRFHTGRYSAPDEIYTVVYDESDELFYYALRSGDLVKMNCDFECETLLKFSDVVASIRYDKNNKKIYVPFSLVDDISVVDAKSGRIDYTFKGQHDVSYVFPYEKGGKLFVVYTDEDVSRTVWYSLSDVRFYGVVSSLKIADYVLTGILFVAAALLFAAFFSPEAGNKIGGGIKWFARNLWKGKYIYLVMLPSLALLMTFCYYPAIASIINAFYDYSAGSAKVFVGINNFVEIVHDPYFGEMVRNMFIFMTSDCLLALCPPIFFAFCLSIMRNKKLSRFMRFALFFPGILPGIATSLLWKNGIYGEYGVINALLKAFGAEPIAFLGSAQTSVGSLIFMGFPWVGSYLIFYGALMNVPPEIYESAELEGCKLWRRLVSIDLPFIMGQIKYVFIITFIHSVQSLGKLQATTKGGVGTMTPMYKLYMYLNNNEYGMASAMAVMMMLVLSVVTAINMRNKMKSEASYA